jgi:hypothetical protein
MKFGKMAFIQHNCFWWILAVGTLPFCNEELDKIMLNQPPLARWLLMPSYISTSDDAQVQYQSKETKVSFFFILYISTNFNKLNFRDASCIFWKIRGTNSFMITLTGFDARWRITQKNNETVWKWTILKWHQNTNLFIRFLLHFRHKWMPLKY